MKSKLTDKLKRQFLQAVVVSVLLYGYTTWTLTKQLENKLDGSCTRMLRAFLNKPWKQHHTREQLYGHLPRISQTIRVRRARHAGHCWRSKDQLVMDMLMWAAQPGPTLTNYVRMLVAARKGSMNDREGSRRIVMDIRANCAT